MPHISSYGDAMNPTHSDEVDRVLGHTWPVVSVKWVDAEARGGPGWEDPEDMVEFALRPLATVHTVGLLIYECEQFVAVTDSRGPDQIGAVQKIPRGWITSLEFMVPEDDSVPKPLPLDGSRAS
ncbi:MAG: hypothetical protein HOO04_10515 [Phycisphaerae bacterium]|jgi:hypothetical protein|nr:hypothetical protein [Phycisphaerae bacterium]MBT5382958.1 hypothetical protein [Phycisphaerae bacterium]MBT5584561.1 hypothetical protein [Phycisphaerae bacterium]MBT5656845.1 hypothetical protein [Phycisphaerae bacterium]MBT7351861.1 hypothetical protein [Phycisphaerae bacterium]